MPCEKKIASNTKSTWNKCKALTFLPSLRAAFCCIASMTEAVQRQSVTELLKEKKSLRTIRSFCFIPDCRQAGLTAPGFLWLSYRLTVLFVGEKYKSDSLGHWHNMLAGRQFWSCWTSVADWKLTAWHCWLSLAFVSGANRLSYLGVATSDFSFFWFFSCCNCW